MDSLVTRHKKAAKWVMLPTGVSQLLTMLALMEHFQIPVTEAETWAYVGNDAYQSLQTILDRICRLFGLPFRGQLDESFRFVVSRKELLLTKLGWQWLLHPEIHARRLLQKQNPQWNHFEGRNVMIPFKPYECFSLFLCATAAPQTVFVADGPLIGNDFALSAPDWRWRGIHNYATPLPGPDTIYCPEYLAHDTQRFGIPKVISADCLKVVYGKLAALPEIRSLVGCFTTHTDKGDAALIVSQPLGPDLCAFEEEVAFYCSMIRTLAENGFKRIVFKPHPRDGDNKIACVAETSRGVARNLRFLNREEAKVPIEVISHLGGTKNWLCAGACSSAILGCRDLLGMEPRCFLSRQLPERVQKLISVFAEQNHVPLEIISDRLTKA